MIEIRTDLAVESHDMYVKSKNIKELPGVNISKYKEKGILVTRVNITKDESGRLIGKEKGNYVTIEIPENAHNLSEYFDAIVKLFSTELHHLVPSKVVTTLVVGLGNRNITADSLGPKVVDGILITRHLFDLMPDEIHDGISPVCGLTPGVLGITGIETNEIIKGVTQRVKPDLVIAIDALASRSTGRIMTTIQLTDTGITPGGGVNNKRGEIDQKTLNVPVIAIGVPTVIDAKTMANDIFDAVSKDNKDKEKIINSIITDNFENLIVTPKDVDDEIDDMAEIISQGINICLHSAITVENAEEYN